jgi:GDP-D-mannose dehydratase
LRLLEAIRILGVERSTRFYQASTSELYGKSRERSHKTSRPHSIRVRPMRWRSSMATGSW